MLLWIMQLNAVLGLASGTYPLLKIYNIYGMWFLSDIHVNLADVSMFLSSRLIQVEPL